MMTIQALVCRPDGTQAMETREVPEDWFALPEQDAEQKQT